MLTPVSSFQNEFRTAATHADGINDLVAHAFELPVQDPRIVGPTERGSKQ